MTLKELEKVLTKDDFLVEIQYTKKAIYELRNSKDIKKYNITYNQFVKLKSKFNFKHLKLEGTTL